VLDVKTLREIFRQLQAWRSIYESDQVDTITGPGGEEICLWDIEYLYSQLYRIPRRQREAIELYLVDNLKESDAAIAMGLKDTNPVGIYASVGLEKLIDMINAGELPRFGVKEELRG
jgi:DNA-directed RNA polymerase specialized sigma24 family protein